MTQKYLDFNITIVYNFQRIWKLFSNMHKVKASTRIPVPECLSKVLSIISQESAYIYMKVLWEEKEETVMSIYHLLC